MFKNLLVISMLALSSCAFYTNVCDCESVTEEKQEKLTKLLEPAIKDKNFELVEFLVQEGADIKSIANKNWGTEEDPVYPLFYAMLDVKHDFRLAELLIKNEADVNKCGYNVHCIEMISIFPDKEGLKLLLDNGVDVNYINKKGESILDIFASHNIKNKYLSLPDREEIAQMLINAGAKLNKYKDDKEVKAFLGIE